MRIYLLHFLLLILICFSNGSFAQITGSIKPVDLKHSVNSADAIYSLKIIEAKTHSYSYRGDEYYCGIEYKAEILEVLKGNGNEGKSISFSTWIPLTIQTKYLVFLHDLSQSSNLQSDAKIIEKFKVGRINRIDSPEDKECDQGLPLLRADLERDIYEFDNDLEFKTKEQWLRYIPVRASIILPEMIKQVPISKQCGDPIGKKCFFDEMAIRWTDLREAIRRLN